MNRNILFVIFALALPGFPMACAGPPPDDGGPSSKKPDPPDVALEEAIADAETGKDPVHARGALEAVLADGALSKENRVRADNALARLVETTDKERAATLLEDAIALGDEGAEDRLFKLLTGHAGPSVHREPSHVAASARALARFLPTATAERKIDLDIVSFGGSGHTRSSDDLGTFAIGSALYENALEACGFCEDPKTNIHTHHSDLKRWSAIPGYTSRLERAFVVLYVDAQTMVPQRYAKWLALPAADLEAALDRGDGIVAVKERAGAPPLITLGAPRAAQLHIVEAAFSAMTNLPSTPATVKLPAALTEEEIGDALRLRAAGADCTKDLLARSPDATWSTEVTFRVDGSGAVTDVAVQGRAPNDPGFRACVERHVSSARFPAWSKDPHAKTIGHFQLLRTPDMALPAVPTIRISP